MRPHLPSCRDDARPHLPSVVLGPHLPSCRDNARSASAYTHGRYPDPDVVTRCCSRAHGRIIRRVHRVKAASCVVSRQCEAEWQRRHPRATSALPASFFVYSGPSVKLSTRDGQGMGSSERTQVEQSVCLRRLQLSTRGRVSIWQRVLHRKRSARPRRRSAKFEPTFEQRAGLCLDNRGFRSLRTSNFRFRAS